MVVTLFDILSLILVGAVWGCTNPFLRKGSLEAQNAKEPEPSSRTTKDTTSEKENTTSDQTKGERETNIFSLLESLSRFRNVGVWLPYALNQSGSLLYYKLLATSDLTLAVPICNSLALVFSSITASLYMGERVNHPLRAMFGSFLVIVGVSVCVMSSSSSSEVKKGASQDTSLSTGQEL